MSDTNFYVYKIGYAYKANGYDIGIGHQDVTTDRTIAQASDLDKFREELTDQIKKVENIEGDINLQIISFSRYQFEI
jgi:hypothetical protein